MDKFIDILTSMQKNPEGFRYDPLNTKNTAQKEEKPKEEVKEENQETETETKGKGGGIGDDVAAHANLIYSTIKNFLSGSIEIKGNF